MSHKQFLLSFLLITLTGCANQGKQADGFPAWAVLLLLAALIVIVWLIIRMSRKKEEEPEAAIPEPAEVVAPEVTEPDDLTLIEGIGPKIKSVLQAAGVQTFAQLADMTPEKIKELITEAGIRLGVTDTWPKQAKLAAEGRMEELKALQDELQGGREA